MTRPLVPPFGSSRLSSVIPLSASLKNCLSIFQYLSSSGVRGGLERAHESRIEIMVNSPRLPGMSTGKYIWPGHYTGRRRLFSELEGFRIPGVKLFVDICFHIKIILFASVKENVLQKMRLKDIVVVQNTGPKLLKGRSGNTFPRIGQVNNHGLRMSRTSKCCCIYEVLIGENGQ